MIKLTPRQSEILAFIKRCLEENGYPPTRAEIAQELGFKSPNAAEEHLKALNKKGAIEMTPGASRGIRIPGFEPAADESSLPIIGRVAAGAPILAQQHVEESCQINPAFFHPPADYLLRVHGMSMKDVGIFDGDLLAVHTAREARNGQIVVARIDDEVTVKRFKREGKKVWLLAENPEFAPIEVDLEHQELVIEGLSVGVIRR
ncbi:transcriptional repressor LexA [Stutzerimonas nitrititolerans]|uniref:LexA repressor n=1 Tax=Stutzerimonas nitrititolerans TaxID=2482751 RepID=A0AA41WKI0_9GAMM|nr:transcriptional repressor LexA [Stutzerimonas nitrititolerans]AFN77433.1 LexA repressor [Stutzerimonas stutzeri DSM 10701]KRW74106.1 LexA family transcriptional regulator [Pseudomonas sp. TTU2014-066ASC]KRW74867.1 LexA family transcriptional regulator [Pseudomonas sp. TTU2014-096BSC]MBA1184966.1 transcriptional repressor LexA [Stutzerimonas stutzeri]OCX23599.1 repressor LexA [Stutzerimonas xanthomarina]RRV20151.1 transcriptional repressor LexA [Pseudomonas sp. s199]WAD27764.1 transcriptio